MQQSIIYKYRNYTDNNHKNVLLKNELYLSPPNTLNDIFDCKIPPNLSLLNTDKKRWEYAERIFNRSAKNLNELDNIKNKLIEEYCDRLKNNIKNEQNLISQITLDTQNNMLGIISFSYNWKNNLMWSHYGDVHKGVCYGFNRVKLEKSKLFTCGGSVCYSNNIPEINPLEAEKLETIALQAFYKSTDWKYEQEYRLLKIFDYNVENLNSEKRKVHIPNNYISEIILGSDFPDKEIKNILTVANKKNIKVYKTEKEEKSFQLNKILIN